MKEDNWYVVERNVAICPKCNGGCALWKPINLPPTVYWLMRTLWKDINLAPTVYWLMCDYCDYEKIVAINEKEKN